jgi:hypothetical protein
MQQCFKILLFLVLNEAQHVSGDTSPIIRSLKLHKLPLVSHTWKVFGRAVVGCCQVAYERVQCTLSCATRHVQQPSTYAKPEAACAVLGSWWWVVCRPKHVELHLKQWIIKFWYTVASCWGFLCKNCTMMHGSTNVKFTYNITSGVHNRSLVPLCANL